MTYPNPDAEEALGRATLALFEALGWTTVNAYHKAYDEAQVTATRPRLISGQLDVSHLPIDTRGADGGARSPS